MKASKSEMSLPPVIKKKKVIFDIEPSIEHSLARNTPTKKKQSMQG
jgi:hypothetical protein